MLSKSSLPTSVEQVIDTMSGSTHPMGVLSSTTSIRRTPNRRNTRPADIDSFEEAASVIVAAIPVIAAKTLPSKEKAWRLKLISLGEALHMMFGNAGGETPILRLVKLGPYFFYMPTMSKIVQHLHAV